MAQVLDNSAAPKTGEGLKVLVIDDESFHAETVAESLERVGYECVLATSGSAGARQIEQEDYDVIVTDLKMADLDGLAILRKAREELPEAEVIMITGHGDVKTAVEAIKQGAANYLTKPVDLAELRAIVDRAAERLRLAKINRELKRQLDEKFGFEGVIGNSPAMHEVIKACQAIAPTNATVLILGETGTGKELIARAIHNNSPRKNKPFAPLNCTAFNENLLDDELFGHEVGAFTGADKMRKGRFEYANGGTLFLDEIGDMPMTLQAKLLRVLENKEVFRIGSNEPIKVNVRLVSATFRDLEQAIAEGKFRQDLYHRLKVMTIRLPPLRERREDIALLAAHFIKEMNAQHGKHVTSIAEPVRKAMTAYDWPGNVRELRNFIESMVVLDTDGVLNLDDVQDSAVLRKASASDGRASGPAHLVGRPLTEVERYYIEQALALTEGNREDAAKMLGIGERTLYRVIQDWKLQDRIRTALDDAHHDIAAAAKTLNMKETVLERKIKKWGWNDKES
ncbi:MAG TPA: sigma-54 dependent transcriptional regulator [Gemmataceae bacterium]|jgi:two-component system response regulator HydG